MHVHTGDFLIIEFVYKKQYRLKENTTKPLFKNFINIRNEKELCQNYHFLNQ